eukprot:943634-Rhodomonas_salina.5
MGSREQPALAVDAHVGTVCRQEKRKVQQDNLEGNCGRDENLDHGAAAALNMSHFVLGETRQALGQDKRWDITGPRGQIGRERAQT